jgi:hypothetical protein
MRCKPWKTFRSSSGTARVIEQGSFELALRHLTYDQPAVFRIRSENNGLVFPPNFHFVPFGQVANFRPYGEFDESLAPRGANSPHISVAQIPVWSAVRNPGDRRVY